MNTALTPVIAVHAAAGAVALVAMWVPIATRKGSRPHRLGGRVYAVSMGLATVLALGICAVRLATGDNPTAAAFLGLVAAMTGLNLRDGLGALRRPEPDHADRAAPWLLGGLGVAGVIGGALTGHVLLGVFGALNVALGALVQRQLPYRKDKRRRIQAHLRALLVACIGTVTAFLVVNYSHLPDAWQVVPGIVVWVAPGVLGGLAIRQLSARYEPA
jgi:uncharacterized membrane protein